MSRIPVIYVNSVHARTEMAREYSNHHFQSFVAGKYVTANISSLDCVGVILYTCQRAMAAAPKQQWWVFLKDLILF